MVWFAVLLLLLANPTPTELSGKVVKITDGDTCVVLVGQQQVKVRLASIDAPESRQPWGTRSRERLGELVHEKEVVVSVAGKDRYGRVLGTLIVDGRNVNEILVSEGFAWHYVAYSKSARLTRLEQEAREAKRGLWADKDPIPPWEWRKLQKPAKHQ
ncbi:thermonuclease family protein [Schlesneria sp. DSM 10557]|uniref:thermonuclease family protein n=1 Tax=Schlesneria sp. DSM 10557 TaxID=3044399 RepID=UPI0035A0B699